MYKKFIQKYEWIEHISTDHNTPSHSFRIQNSSQNKYSFRFSIQLYLYLFPPLPLLVLYALSIFLLLLNSRAQLLKLHLF